MRSKPVLIVGTALLLFLATSAGAACTSHRPVAVGLANGRLRPCPSARNCVCSEFAGDAAIEPLAFAGDPEQALRSLVEFLAAQSNVEVVEQHDGYVHAVYTTRFLRFADDVEFRLDPAAGVIQVRSESRVGYSDLGTNRARIEDLRSRWQPPSENAD